MDSFIKGQILRSFCIKYNSCYINIYFIFAPNLSEFVMKILQKNVSLATLLNNLGLSLGVLTICRLVFYISNISYFSGLKMKELFRIFQGGLFFDLSAMMYINGLYLLMATVLFYKNNNRTYQKIMKFVFVLFNVLAVVANLMDTVYFPFTNRRTTASIFNEFKHDNNFGSVISSELVHSWYLVVIAGLLIFLLYKFYKKNPMKHMHESMHRFYLVQTLIIVLLVPCYIIAIRGGIRNRVRPISNSTANIYVKRPLEAAIVLNTPFSIFRTIGKTVYENPHYFSDEALMNKVYSPVHISHSDSSFKPLNVVVFIMESFGKEYVGELNNGLQDGEYKGYTPFLDSLIKESLTFEYSYANGRSSVDGSPSSLSSIPMLISSYFLTHYSMNKVSGIAGELKKKGYHTSYFHGAVNGSMGFEYFSKASGYDEYYGLNEYENKKDFDGVWAVWDEEFFQFFANKLNSFKQPFTSAIFSATSHHPFKIPDRYRNIYKEEGHPIHKCIRYSDNALKLFFDRVSKEPWFKNTLFVITADHTNASSNDEYKTDAGLYSVPIIFYHPGSDLKGRIPSVAQQIDIMPTVLGYLRYDKPYVAFGNDLLHTPLESRFALNYNNHVYQYFKGQYMLQFDGEKSIALYDVVSDRLLKDNLLGKIDTLSIMETELKAIVQQYVERMLSDRLTIGE